MSADAGQSVLALTTYAPVPTSGRAIVLVHGFPVDHRMWDDVGDHLARDPAVGGLVGIVAPDLPGLGATGLVSTEPVTEPSLTVAAALLARALDAAGITSAVAVGMSMGGYVTMVLLTQRPDLVAGLGLVDTKHTADDAAARAKRLACADQVTAAGSVDAVRGMATSLLAASARGVRTDLTARVDAIICEQAPAGVAWSQRAMAARTDSTDVLRDFRGPGLVVVGEEDDVTTPAAAETMLTLLDDGVLVTIPGAGHLAAMERPVAVAEAIKDLVVRIFEP